jgi:hypothetical protein
MTCHHLPGVIKHPTLVHQSVKITDLLKADILIDLKLKPTLELHTLGYHSIFGIDIGTKPRQLLKLSGTLRNKYAPLLQLHEFHFLFLKSSGKYFLKNSPLNLSQDTTLRGLVVYGNVHHNKTIDNIP